MSRRKELQYWGIRLQGALLAQGYFQLAVSGAPYQISFKRVYADEHQPYGFYQVDLDSLPADVNQEILATPTTAQLLSTMIGRPVKAINGTGLTYCVKL